MKSINQQNDLLTLCQYDCQVALNIECTGSISLYLPCEEATIENYKKHFVKIKLAFPELHDNFFVLLADRLLQNKISERRFKDAVNYVIDNCKYPRPAVADFIQYDLNIPSLSRTEMQKEIHEKNPNTNYIAHKGRYIRKCDLRNLGIDEKYFE